MGEKFEVSEEIRKRVFKELGKVPSDQELQAYLTNVAGHDYTKAFIKSHATKASYLTEAVCTRKQYFPEVFQLSYKWIFDAWGIKELCSKRRVQQFKKYLTSIKAAYCQTAGGSVPRKPAAKFQYRKARRNSVGSHCIARIASIIIRRKDERRWFLISLGLWIPSMSSVLYIT